MSIFKTGDVVELDCSVEEFKANTMFGKTVYGSCFKDGVATVRSDHDGWKQISLVKVNSGGGDLIKT